jgi:hypothetical protein
VVRIYAGIVVQQFQGRKQEFGMRSVREVILLNVKNVAGETYRYLQKKPGNILLQQKLQERCSEDSNCNVQNAEETG